MNFAIKLTKFGVVSKGRRQRGFQLATLRPAFVGGGEGGEKKNKVKLFLTVLDFSGANMLLQSGEI